MEHTAAQNSEEIQVAPEVSENPDKSQDQQQPVETKAVEEDRQERNWKAFREKQKELERELRFEREVNERLLKMTSLPTPTQEIDEFEKISDEEFIPKGQVKRLVAKEKDNIVKDALAEFEKKQQQRDQALFLERLKKQYNDFEDVVTPETLSILENQEPELATMIAELKDPYKMGLQSYKYIKALKITDKAPEARRKKEVENKLEKNAKTVPSPQVYDKRPMAQAFQMNEQTKNQLYKEMMQFSRMASSVPEMS